MATDTGMPSDNIFSVLNLNAEHEWDYMSNE